MAFICGGPYVIGHDEFGLQLLVAPMVDGKPLYYSYIIVGKDSEIENLDRFIEIDDPSYDTIKGS